MPETDPQHRDLAQQLRRLAVGPHHRGGVAGPVGEHHAVRPGGEDLRSRRARRHHPDPAADVDQLAKDASLDAVVDHHDLVPDRLRVPAGDTLRPVVGLLAGDLRGEILPFHAGQLSRAVDQRLRRCARRVDDPLLRPHAAQDAHQPARVDALDAHHAVAGEPVGERFVAAPVGRLAADAPRDEPSHLRELGLLVSAMHAVVAQLRHGEGDELPGVGGIGEDLLVAGVAGVEDHLARRLAGGAAGKALEDVARGERERGLLHRPSSPGRVSSWRCTRRPSR